MQYRYIGCFFDFERLYESLGVLPYARLQKVIQHPHVTFAYMPGCVDTSLFGQKIKVRAIGYGNDGNNEGLYVELQAENVCLQAMADAISVPHITLSVSNAGEPVNTAKLNFVPIEPIDLEGVFGGFCLNGKVQTENR